MEFASLRIDGESGGSFWIRFVGAHWGMRLDVGHRGEKDHAWGFRARGDGGRRIGSGSGRKCTQCWFCSMPARLVMGISRPVLTGHHALFILFGSV